MKKIKILEVNNIDSAGTIFNGYDFIDNLDKSKFVIKQAVIIKQSNNSKVVKILNDDNKMDLFNKLISYENAKSIHNIISLSSECLINLKEYKAADIIHIHMFHNTKLSIASLIKITSEKKVIISLHDPWFLTGRCVHFYKCDKWKKGCGCCKYLDNLFPLNEDNTKTLWKIKEEVFKNLDINIIVPSKWMYDLVKISPIFKTIKNVKIIPFGVEEITDLKINASREYFKIPNDNKVIFLRAQNEFKGTKYALEALKKLQINEKITILTCDQTGLLDDIKDKYNIIDLGYISEQEVNIAINACDIFLSVSNAESFGVMLIKAMMQAKPVIVFNNTAMPSVACAPKCGYLVEDKNTDELKDAIKALLTDKNEYQKRASLCKKFAQENYRVEDYYKKIEQYYIKVNNNKKCKTTNNLKFNENDYLIMVNSIDNYLQKGILDNKIINIYNSSNILAINKLNEYIYKKYANKFVEKLSIKEKIKRKLKKNKIIYKTYKMFFRR